MGAATPKPGEEFICKYVIMYYTLTSAVINSPFSTQSVGMLCWPVLTCVKSSSDFRERDIPG